MRLRTLEEMGYQVVKMDQLLPKQPQLEDDDTAAAGNPVLTHYQIMIPSIVGDGAYYKTRESPAAAAIGKLAVWSGPQGRVISDARMPEPAPQPKGFHHDDDDDDDDGDLDNHTRHLLVYDIKTTKLPLSSSINLEGISSFLPPTTKITTRAHEILASFWTYTLHRDLSHLRRVTFVHIVEPDTLRLLEERICPREDVPFDKYHRAPSGGMQFRRPALEEGEEEFWEGRGGKSLSWADLTRFEDLGCNISSIKRNENANNGGGEGVVRAGEADCGAIRELDDDDKHHHLLKSEGHTPPLKSRLVRIVARMIDAYPQVSDDDDDDDDRRKALQIKRIMFSPYRFRGSLVFDMDICLGWVREYKEQEGGGKRRGC